MNTHIHTLFVNAIFRLKYAYISYAVTIFLKVLVWHHQFSSVAQSCRTLQHRGLQHARPPCPSPAVTQTHVHWVSDAIQPSHPLSSPSLPSFNLFQHQGLFQCISSLHQVAKVLEFQLQHPSVLQMNVQDWFPLGWPGWISLQSKGLSRVFSNTMVQKQFFCTQLSL